MRWGAVGFLLALASGGCKATFSANYVAGGPGSGGGGVNPTGSGGIISSSGGAVSGGASSSGTGNSGSGSGGTGSGGIVGGGTGGATVSNTCGNGQIEQGESCDGSNLNGMTCSSLGFQSGTLGCAAGCAFDTSQCVGAVTVKVSPSRTSCTAPCAVFFDATGTVGLMGNDYVGANFSWDFDSTSVNPSGLHQHTIGFVSAHVYDVAGTYQVATRVRDLAGHGGSTTTAITVTAMTGTTYYVASSGNDSNSGTSMTQPLATVAAAMKHAGAQNSVLLRRGDTFNIGSAVVPFNSLTGPFLLGAYTDPSSKSTATPILSSTVTSATNNHIGDVNGSTDLRFTDLHVVATTDAWGGFFLSNTKNILFERVEIEKVGQPSNDGTNFLLTSPTDGSFFVDSHIHDFDGLGIYGDRTVRFALIGTTIEKYTNADHGVRIQGGNTLASFQGFAHESYVAENSIVPTPGGGSFDSIAFRGDDTNIVEVNNYYESIASFTPQNAQQLEHISNVLYDSNTSKGQNTGNGSVGICAQHVVVRNSVFANTYLTVDVQGAPLLPAGYVDQIFIYNNTSYFFPTPANSNGTYFVKQSNGMTGNITLQNNIFATGSSSSVSSLVSTDGMGTQTINNNLLYAPNVSGGLPAAEVGPGSLTKNPQFTSTDLSGTNAFALMAGSPAIDSGIATAAYSDIVGVARPQGAGWDIGAYEYMPPTAAGATDASVAAEAVIRGGLEFTSRAAQSP